MPLTHDPSATISWCTSAWLEDGTFVNEILLRRRGRETNPPPLRPTERALDGEHIYGGIIQEHYGHFLLESMARYWYIKDHPDRPLVWHKYESDELTAWQAEIFEMLGLRWDPDSVVLAPTKFEKLTIPQPGAEIWTTLTSEQAKALAVYEFAEPAPGKRVWISRSRWRKARVVGEKKLERMLGKAGWDIMYPETLSVREQLALMSDAEVIAGFDGSAFHTLLLAAQVRAKVVIVPRYEKPRIPSTYHVIAKTKGFEQSLVTTPLTWVGGEGRGGAEHRLDHPRKLAAALVRYS